MDVSLIFLNFFKNWFSVYWFGWE